MACKDPFPGQVNYNGHSLHLREGAGVGINIYNKDNLAYHLDVPEYIKQFIEANPNCEVRVPYDNSDLMTFSFHSKNEFRTT